MRQVTRKSLMTVAAATGVLAAVGGSAQADSGASGSSSNSPGVLSGNTVQAPVHAPVNVCGNTVNLVGLLNPAVGNSCVNSGEGSNGGFGDSGGSGSAHSDGHASDSPGVGSGNHVEVPVHVPVNACGNSVDIIGVGNGTTSNGCANGGGSGGGGQENLPGTPEQPLNPRGPENPNNPNQPINPSNPGNPDNLGNPGDLVERSRPGTPLPSGDLTPDGSPRGGDRSVTEPQGGATLAATGSELPLGLVLPVGAGALLAGTVLYRKARASA